MFTTFSGGILFIIGTIWTLMSFLLPIFIYQIRQNTRSTELALDVLNEQIKTQSLILIDIRDSLRNLEAVPTDAEPLAQPD